MREYIVSRVAEMYTKYGVKTVRMDDVATALGVSKRTLYEIFGDKETLVRECMVYLFSRWGGAIRSRTENATNVFEEMFMIMSFMHRNYDESHIRMMEEIKRYYPKIGAELAQLADRDLWKGVRKIISRGVGQGLLRPDTSVDMLVAVFSYLADHNFIDMLGFKYNISRAEAFEFVGIMFMRGVATDKGIEIINGLEAKYGRAGSLNMDRL